MVRLLPYIFSPETTALCPLRSFIFLFLIFDTAHHFDSVTAFFTDCNIDIEYSLEAFRPGHRGVTVCGGVVICCTNFLALVALAAFCRCYQYPQGIKARSLQFGANTPWNRVRLTRGFGTRAASRAMKSNGSKMTWVVPDPMAKALRGPR
jgi:hypothetical protein